MAQFRHGFHDLRTSWVDYFQVFPDELVGHEKVTLAKLRASAVFYVDRKVRFDVYWGKPGSYYAPFISPFDQSAFVNFSAWGYGAELWTRDGMGDAHPLCYVDKRKESLIQKLADIPIFTPVHVWAEIRSKSEGQPWVEIVGAEVIPEQAFNDTSLRHLAMGHVQMSRKRFDLAIRAYEGALRVEMPVRGEVKAYHSLARAYFELRMYSCARNASINAYLRDQTNVNNLILLARADLRINRADEAKQAVEKAILLEPTNPDAHAELGLALAMLGDIRAGYKEIEVAQKLARNQLPEANRNRAKIALIEGKLDLARDELNQAVIYRPTDVDLKLELGEIYLQLNKPDDARREFTQARDLAPARAEPYYKLALLLKKQADALVRDGKQADAKALYEEALKNIENALTKEDQFAPAYDLQIELLRILGRSEEIHKVLLRGTKIKGNEHLLPELKYEDAALSGDFPAMESALRSVITARPDSPYSHSRLGRILSTKPNPDMPAAAAEYEEAVRLSPDSAEDWAALGHIRACYIGNYVAAEEALLKAIALDPKNASAWHNLGAAARHMGKHDQAIEAAEKAVAISPSPDSKLLIALARLGRGKPEDIEVAAKLGRDVSNESKIDQDRALAQSITGATLLMTGKIDDALAAFILADPVLMDNAEHKLWYGTALIQKGKLDEAKEQLAIAKTLSAAFTAQSKVAARVSGSADKAIEDVTSLMAARAPKPIEAPLQGDPTAKKIAPVIEEENGTGSQKIEVPRK